MADFKFFDQKDQKTDIKIADEKLTSFLFRFETLLKGLGNSISIIRKQKKEPVLDQKDSKEDPALGPKDSYKDPVLDRKDSNYDQLQKKLEQMTSVVEAIEEEQQSADKKAKVG